MSVAAARNWLGVSILVLMAATSIVGDRVRPAKQPTDSAAEPGIVLSREIPQAFGDWTMAAETSGIVVNPELQSTLDRLYSEILTRTYVNSHGYLVMVSAAYGHNQRGGLQAHLPEVCYPAQGFEVLSNETAEIATPLGAIKGRRLLTRREARQEPVTYWFSLGGKPVGGRIESRLEELRFVLSGQIPEGVLFRVSSIDPDGARAHREQEHFVQQLVLALPADVRHRVSGL